MLKKIEETMQPVGDSAKELFTDPTVLSMLLGGVGSGLAGGYLSSRAGGYEGEDKKKRRKRILMNALLAGGAGAAAGGLASTAYKSLNTALPEDDVDPTSAMLTPLMRGGAVGGLGAFLHNRGAQAELRPQRGILSDVVSEASRHSGSPAYDDLAKRVTDALDAGGSYVRDQFDTLHSDALSGGLSRVKGVEKAVLGDKERLLRAGGLNTYDMGDPKYWYNKDAWKGVNTNFGDMFSGTAPGRFAKRIFGHSPIGRVGAGLGLTAAALSPEILGYLARGVTGHEV